MTTFRKIYEIEVFTANGELKARRFAKNKKTAEKIAKQYNGATITSVPKSDWNFINPEWVEG